MTTTIYYFSGTGNSLKVAKDLAKEIQDTKLVQITKDKMKLKNDKECGKIGIIYPVYKSGLPILVKKFLENLEISKNTYVFTVATYGAGAGISFHQIEEILKNKGLKLSAAFGVSMPGNYQVLYAPFSVKTQQKRFENEELKTKEIAKCINNNEIVKIAGSGKSFKNTIARLMYKSFNPYEADKNFWTDENCNGCTTCSKVCPVNNIVMKKGKPNWNHKCEQCMACMQWCPKKSVQYKKVTIKRGRYTHPNIQVQELFNNSNK
ncbi:EFR1 family ferrodoxin [Clostridium sp.]|uniref:EFR1 family ferrodoxin n=1 Tax=Clostridium sp. TaxID=1506 RepID=UPI002FC7FDB0